MANRQVSVLADGVELPADLGLPDDCHGIAIFAHGSGSSRQSPRNRAVAAYLNEIGVATLLVDLLTNAEAIDRRNVFDIGLLGDRLIAATAWVRAQPEMAHLAIGYFGASTGGAAALVAAAQCPDEIVAVVSRGGRPDLAGEYLAKVRAATLLIVGGHDPEVLVLNQRAAASLRADHELTVVPGATHLFQEPGALEAVAQLAGAWFLEHFREVPGV